jgi:phospholipase A1
MIQRGKLTLSPRWLLAAAALWTTVALAQPAPASKCGSIRNDTERLECYDREAGLPREEAPRETSLIGAAWALDPASERVQVRFYQPNYALLWRRTSDANRAPYSPSIGATPPIPLDENEAKYQLSFKARLFAADGRRWGVWFGYTQQSHWQVYSADTSRPFRETNYKPEALVVYDPELEYAGWRWRLASIGVVHQSNGRSLPLSRSWNRIIGQLGVEKGDFALVVRPWVRIHEDAADDNNPDITDYTGHGDATLVYKWSGHSLSLTVRGNVATGKGAAQFGWMSPRLLGPLRVYVQAFSGYGESLIDYNWRQNTFGFGFALNDLL